MLQPKLVLFSSLIRRFKLLHPNRLDIHLLLIKCCDYLCVYMSSDCWKSRPLLEQPMSERRLHAQHEAVIMCVNALLPTLAKTVSQVRHLSKFFV
jgi:hypothetical protein